MPIFRVKYQKPTKDQGTALVEANGVQEAVTITKGKRQVMEVVAVESLGRFIKKQ